MLLFYVKPYPDETLCSFLLRTAKENLMDNLNWILINFSTFAKDSTYLNEVNWLSGERLIKMANFLSITHETAESLTFRYTLKKLDLNYNNSAKNPWFLYSRVRCCPQCIKDKAYYRKKWSSSHSLICLDHKVFLIEKCSDCKKQFDIQDIINDKCKRCNKTISSSNSKKAQNLLLELYQNIIDDIFNEKSFSYEHPWIQNSTDFFRTLEFIACWAARLFNYIDLSNHEFSMKYDGKILERNHLKNAKSVEQATCIYYFAFQVIDNWPTGFYKFLESAESGKKPLYSYFLRNIIPALKDTSLWPISRELTNYIVFLKMKIPRENQFIRSDEIKNINQKFNASILHSKELHILKLEYYGTLFTFINEKEAKAFFRRFENSITKEELRERWGTSAKSTYSILKNNLIDNTINFSSGSVSSWVIPQESIESIETYLVSISRHIKELAITLGLAFQWIGPENSHILIRGILNKDIQFQWSGGKLGDCLVIKKEVYLYMKEELLKQCKNIGFISLKDLTFILGVKKSDLDYWISTQRFGINQSRSLNVIPLDQYLYFAEKYITTLELAMILNLSIKQILKKQSNGQLPVVSGPKVNDGKRILYDRTFTRK